MASLSKYLGQCIRGTVQWTGKGQTWCAAVKGVFPANSNFPQKACLTRPVLLWDKIHRGQEPEILFLKKTHFNMKLIIKISFMLLNSLHVLAQSMPTQNSVFYSFRNSEHKYWILFTTATSFPKQSLMTLVYNYLFTEWHYEAQHNF